MPFVSFVLLAVVGPLRRTGRGAGVVSIAAIAISFAAALSVWHRGLVAARMWDWIPADGGPIATVGVLVDPLTNAMLVLVTLISLLVQIYSLAYLAGPRLHLPVALRLRDAGARAGAGLLADVHLLGAGRPLLVSADRLLVRAPGRRARRGEGVLDHEARRHRFHRRHRAPVVGDRHVRVRRSFREGAGERAGSAGPGGDHVPDLPRCGGQVGPVPPARVAPGRDGGAHTGLGAHPRGHDGHRRCLHGDADGAALR